MRRRRKRLRSGVGAAGRWQDGKFIHPHDACFDAEGNIYVAEWGQRGRVTRMTRIA